MKNRILKILFAVFAVIFVVSSALLIRELVIRRHAADYMDSLQQTYKPSIPGEGSIDVDKDIPGEPENKDEPNPTVQALVDKYPDAVGWLTVEGAEVSHPFVVGEDNAEYIRADLDGSYIVSGSLFMDYRNSRDMTDGVTVIYGHNMKDHTMFAKLTNYRDNEFLRNNPDVYVSLPEKTVHYTAFACMIVDATESPIYQNFGPDEDISDITDYITRNAEYLNSDVHVDGSSRLLVLSTCNPVYFTARAVLICVAD